MGIGCRVCCCLCLFIAASPAEAGLIRFLVGELGTPVHGDSYVVLIDDQDTQRIEHARQIVAWHQAGQPPAQRPDGLIVVAPVIAGADGINRNHLAPGAPPWSWHTGQPIDFADSTIEILDGWPTFIEQDVNGWIANTNGFLGFWSYSIIDELGQVPEPTGIAAPMIALMIMVEFHRKRRRLHS